MHEHAVGGNAVALGKQNVVAAHHVAAGDAYPLAVPKDERSRRRKVAQCRKRVLGLVLLVDLDADHDHDERHQDGAVERLGEQEVDGAGAEEEQQHRLANHVQRLLQKVPLLRCRQLIRPVGRQTLRRLGRRQTDKPDVLQFGQRVTPRHEMTRISVALRLPSWATSYHFDGCGSSQTSPHGRHTGPGATRRPTLGQALVLAYCWRYTRAGGGRRAHCGRGDGWFNRR